MIAGEDEDVFILLKAGQHADLPFEVRFPDLSSKFFEHQSVTSSIQGDDVGFAADGLFGIKIFRQDGNDRSRDLFLTST